MTKKVLKQDNLPQSIPLEPLNLFPTMSSLRDVIDLAEAKVPIKDKNDAVSLLATYHNTLLSELEKKDRLDTGDSNNDR